MFADDVITSVDDLEDDPPEDDTETVGSVDDKPVFIRFFGFRLFGRLFSVVAAAGLSEGVFSAAEVTGAAAAPSCASLSVTAEVDGCAVVFRSEDFFRFVFAIVAVAVVDVDEVHTVDIEPAVVVAAADVDDEEDAIEGFTRAKGGNVLNLSSINSAAFFFDT